MQTDAKLGLTDDVQRGLGRGAVDGVRLRGHVRIEQWRDGELVDLREGHNLVTTVGEAWMAGALTGDVAAPTTVKYIGLGTGTGAAATTDTTLGTEITTGGAAEERATGTQSRVTTTHTNDTYQVVGTVTMNSSHAVTEAGLFSASSSGSLFARQVFDALNLVSADTLAITWKVAFADA
jgi:hypothetical protein